MIFSDTAQDLLGAMYAAAERWPAHGFRFLEGSNPIRAFSFGELLVQARAQGATLRAAGFGAGARVLLLQPEPEAFVRGFLATLHAGCVPVPLAPPAPTGDLDAWRAALQRLIQTATPQGLLCAPHLQEPVRPLTAQLPIAPLSLEAPARLRTFADARSSLAASFGAPPHLEARPTGPLTPPDLPAVDPDAAAFVQYSSGSTRSPRGVPLSHRALLANVRAMAAGLALDPARDHCVSWLPLHHDMGLIGFVLAPLLTGMRTSLMATGDFLRRPTRWFDALHTARATISFAPPFAYDWMRRRSRPAQRAAWDLSAVRALGVGAEPIDAPTLRAFAAQFATESRLNPHALMPAYGLAEACLALCFHPLGGPLKTQRVDAAIFQREGRAQPVAPGSAQEAAMIEQVSCGPPLPGYAVVAVDAHDRALPEGVEGELRARGPSIAAGYLHDPHATAAHFRDGALYTGDLGYVLDGEIYVTGRLKARIVHHGRTLHPHDLEHSLRALPDLHPGDLAVFAAPGAATEQIVVAARPRSGADPAQLRAGVAEILRRQWGLSAHTMVCVGPAGLPKTSSGKLRRGQLAPLYAQGAFGAWPEA